MSTTAPKHHTPWVLLNSQAIRKRIRNMSQATDNSWTDAEVMEPKTAGSKDLQLLGVGRTCGKWKDRGHEKHTDSCSHGDRLLVRIATWMRAHSRVAEIYIWLVCFGEESCGVPCEMACRAGLVAAVTWPSCFLASLGHLSFQAHLQAHGDAR